MVWDFVGQLRADPSPFLRTRPVLLAPTLSRLVGFAEQRLREVDPSEPVHQLPVERSRRSGPGGLTWNAMTSGGSIYRRVGLNVTDSSPNLRNIGPVRKRRSAPMWL